MTRSKTDDFLILSLGQRRKQLAAEIASFDEGRLAQLHADLAETEAKLKELDPTILTLAEEASAEAQRAADAVAAAEAVAIEAAGIADKLATPKL